MGGGSIRTPVTVIMYKEGETQRPAGGDNCDPE